MKKVKALTDDSGHWYIIPNELAGEFWKDSENEEMGDTGVFDRKYGKYATGGDLNITQLFIK